MSEGSWGLGQVAGSIGVRVEGEAGLSLDSGTVGTGSEPVTDATGWACWSVWQQGPDWVKQLGTRPRDKRRE